MLRCHFCEGERGPVDPNDPDNWYQVTVWVYGQKRNGACMQGTEILAVAHGGCARLAKMGISHDQGSMF